jgi:hypothetical protein
MKDTIKIYGATGYVEYGKPPQVNAPRLLCFTMLKSPCCHSTPIYRLPLHLQVCNMAYRNDDSF